MTQESTADSSTTQSEASELATIEAAITGDNPHTFRVMQAELDDSGLTPSVRVDGLPSRSIEDMVKLEPTFTAHETVMGVPFTASYLNLEKTYKDIDQKSQKHIQAVDTYLMKRIETGKYVDSAESVGTILREIEAKLHLKDYHDPYYKAERIANYIQAKQDSDKFDTVKPRFTKRALETKRIVEKQTDKISKEVGEKIDSLRNEKKTNKIEKEIARVRESVDKIKQTDLRPIEQKVDRIHDTQSRDYQELSRKVDTLIELEEYKDAHQARTNELLEAALIENRSLVSGHRKHRDTLARLLLE